MRDAVAKAGKSAGDDPAAETARLDRERAAERALRERAMATASGLGCISLGCVCFAAFAVAVAPQSATPWPIKALAILLVLAGAAKAARVAARIADAAQPPVEAGAGKGSAPPRAPDAWPPEDSVLQAAADTDAVAALVQLGYSRRAADEGVAEARRRGLVGRGADAGEVVRAVLGRQD